MSINAKCACGATVEIRAGLDTTEGHRLDEWMKAHNQCVEFSNGSREVEAYELAMSRRPTA